MSYTLLKDLYYKDSQKHHSLYKERFESPYAHHINFNIGDSPAFRYHSGNTEQNAQNPEIR